MRPGSLATRRGSGATQCSSSSSSSSSCGHRRSSGRRSSRLRDTTGRRHRASVCLQDTTAPPRSRWRAELRGVHVGARVPAATSPLVWCLPLRAPHPRVDRVRRHGCVRLCGAKATRFPCTRRCLCLQCKLCFVATWPARAESRRIGPGSGSGSALKFSKKIMPRCHRSHARGTVPPTTNASPIRQTWQVARRARWPSRKGSSAPPSTAQARSPPGPYGLHNVTTARDLVPPRKGETRRRTSHRRLASNNIRTLERLNAGHDVNGSTSS